MREYSVANSGSVKVTLETNSNEDTADGSMKKTRATNVSDGDTGTLREASVSGLILQQAVSCHCSKCMYINVIIGKVTRDTTPDNTNTSTRIGLRMKHATEYYQSTPKRRRLNEGKCLTL